MVDFGDYTNFLRPPPPLVCKLMQLTKAFLTGNHSEDRSRKGRKEGRTGNWKSEDVIKRSMRNQASWSVWGGGEGWVTFHGLSSHQYSNPLLLDQLEHVNSIQQLYKQSGPEAASHNIVDETS